MNSGADSEVGFSCVMAIPRLDSRFRGNDRREGPGHVQCAPAGLSRDGVLLRRTGVWGVPRFLLLPQDRRSASGGVGDQRGLKDRPSSGPAGLLSWIPAPRLHEDKLRGNDRRKCKRLSCRGFWDALGAYSMRPCGPTASRCSPPQADRGLGCPQLPYSPHEWGTKGG